MKRLSLYTLVFAAWILTLICTGCSDVNCPLNNHVFATWSFYKSGEPYVLKDTLNILLKVNGTDSLVANRLYNVGSVDLPMSYFNASDTLTFEIKTASHRNYKDMVIVKKENIPHFNSPECGTWVEHYISSVVLTHNNVDSIAITDLKVDNNEVENFRIHFK